MRNYRKWISGIVVFALNIIMILSLLLCFIFFLAPHNKHLLRFSRIFSIIVITFPVMYAAFARLFGGYDIGVEKCRSIIFALSMRVLLTDAITYVEYLIMSYHSVVRNTLAPQEGEILSLIYAFGVQVAIIALITRRMRLRYLVFRAFRNLDPRPDNSELMTPEKVRALIRQPIPTDDTPMTTGEALVLMAGIVTSVGLYVIDILTMLGG